MNIVYTVNDKFVPQLATGICSICENNRNEQITFFVISSGITAENKNAICDYVKKYNQTVEIIELGNLSDYLDFEFDVTGWNPIVLARLVLTKLLPDSVERVLYLDGDTMVRGSLKELWETDLQGNVLGAAIEPTANAKRKESLGIPAGQPYYNAGVLLIDMHKWKDEFAEKKVLEYYKEHEGRLFANDQDAINGALKDQIYSLPIIYNFCNSYRFYPYRTLCKIMRPAEFVSQKQYEKYLANPIIIHFLGEERPWRIGNKNPFTPEYFQYWNKTPWKDTELESGWQRYFMCFQMFNIFMKLTPMLRYRIMDKLIPMFIKHRSK